MSIFQQQYTNNRDEENGNIQILSLLPFHTLCDSVVRFYSFSNCFGIIIRVSHKKSPFEFQGFAKAEKNNPVEYVIWPEFYEIKNYTPPGRGI